MTVHIKIEEACKILQGCYIPLTCDLHVKKTENSRQIAFYPAHWAKMDINFPIWSLSKFEKWWNLSLKLKKFCFLYLFVAYRKFQSYFCPVCPTRPRPSVRPPPTCHQTVKKVARATSCWSRRVTQARQFSGKNQVFVWFRLFHGSLVQKTVGYKIPTPIDSSV